MTNQHHRLMKWSLSSTHLSYNNDSAKIQADEKKKKKLRLLKLRNADYWIAQPQTLSAKITLTPRTC